MSIWLIETEGLILIITDKSGFKYLLTAELSHCLFLKASFFFLDSFIAQVKNRWSIVTLHVVEDWIEILTNRTVLRCLRTYITLLRTVQRCVSKNNAVYHAQGDGLLYAAEFSTIIKNFKKFFWKFYEQYEKGKSY